MKRVFLIVLDSMGIGLAHDAKAFGDEGSFTLRSVYDTGLARLDTLRSLGLGNICGVDFLGAAHTPLASYARVREASKGKDTTIGHWEIAGHISEKPMPTFPEGFPTELIDSFSKATGRGVLCNRPYSGTAVIRDYGEKHLLTGDLIVYTSADSVFQIAAHNSVLSTDELYSVCETARDLLCGEYAVGRVIARPFAGAAPDFYRTADRRDFSLEPPVKMLPDAVADGGLESVSVGKIVDIFAERGFTRVIRTHSNREGMETASALAKEDFRGLCFVNLVDFDSLWGHRRDPEGYAKGLEDFDDWLASFLPLLGKDDVLMITADHGCDPSFTATTDHTREDVPLLIYSKSLLPVDIGVRDSLADIGATAARLLGVDLRCDGKAIDLIYDKE